MYTACIFDLDGTLLDTLPTVQRYCAQTLEHFGYQPVNLEGCRALCRLPSSEFYHRLLELSGCTDSNKVNELAPQLHDYDVASYLQDTKTGTAVFPGVVEMLTALRARGVKTAVLSNKPHVLAEDLTAHFLPGLIDLCVGQRQGHPAKPMPKSLWNVVADLGLDQQDCIYVGDTDVDMRTAKAAGVYLVAVSWGYMTREQLMEYQPDVMIDRAEELLSLFP